MDRRQRIGIVLAGILSLLVFGQIASADILDFQVDSPASGAVWNPGNTHTIHWYTKDTSGANFPPVWVKVLLYPQGQLKMATTIAELPISNDSTYLNWTVPPGTAAGNYVIRIESPNMVTYTDQYGKTTYENQYGESGVFAIAKPATQGPLLPGQPGWVPPVGLPTGPITPAGEDMAEKKVSGAEKRSAIRSAPNVSGQWKSNIGLVYDITQKGSQFEWTVASTKEKGQGQMNGNDVSASWTGKSGSGSTTGQITAIDANGKATQIDWKNGVRFYR